VILFGKDEEKMRTPRLSTGLLGLGLPPDGGDRPDRP
jgi:hypothetical protein